MLSTTITERQIHSWCQMKERETSRCQGGAQTGNLQEISQTKVEELHDLGPGAEVSISIQGQEMWPWTYRRERSRNETFHEVRTPMGLPLQCKTSILPKSSRDEKGHCLIQRLYKDLKSKKPFEKVKIQFMLSYGIGNLKPKSSAWRFIPNSQIPNTQ